jgi:ubiquinone/menaquinone biosynthesis C-methylase UbiE
VDHEEVARIWDGNAEAWTKLTRLGCDVCRDQVNSPAFFAMLPDVSGKTGIDIGCGEGHNTRLLAECGAQMTAIDISGKFIAYACDRETESPLGIAYRQANAVALPYPDASFDFATAFMSLMDIPENDLALSEAYRVIKPGGFLQFSITHPCFMTRRWKWVCDAAGKRVAVECGDYFAQMDGEIEEWTFGAAPPELKAVLPRFRVPRFTRTLSGWLNLVLRTGFELERFAEPHPDEQSVALNPHLADVRIVAHFFIIRCRRPGDRQGRADLPSRPVASAAD